MPKVKHTLLKKESILAPAVSSMLSMNKTKYDLNDVGGRIGYAIKASGKSVVAVAKELGITRPAVDQWIKGPTQNLKMENLFGLEDATGFAARWIALGDGPERINPALVAINELLAENGTEISQQALDFIGYQLNRSSAINMDPAKTARYMAMLDRFNADIKRRKSKDD